MDDTPRVPLLLMGPSRRFALQDLVAVATKAARIDLEKGTLEEMKPPKVGRGAFCSA
jgi:hypothetical protein